MTKSKKFQHFIHVPLSSLLHLLIRTKTQIFASLSQGQKKVSRVLQIYELVQTVNSIPYTINRISVYKIKPRNRVLLLEALKDRKKWNKHSRTQWTGFASVRYWDCLGYTCPNNKCLFFKQFKYSNHTNLTMNGTCEYYSASGNHQSCSAWKYIAFSNDREAYMYHCGNHTIFIHIYAKDIHKRSTDIVKDVLSKDCNITRGKFTWWAF